MASEVENTPVTLLTANVKLPYDSITIPVNGEKTITLLAGNAEYAFDDITDITAKSTPSKFTFTKVNNKSFKLTAKTNATTSPEALVVVVKKSPTELVELTINVNIEVANKTVVADFGKALYDLAPNVPVEFELVGDDASSCVIDTVVNGNSLLQIDTVAKTLTCTKAGSYINGIVISKNGQSRTIYVQAECSNVISIPETEVTIHTEQTKKLDITFVGDNYTLTSDDPGIATVEKSTRTITPVTTGNCNIIISGTRGTLTQRIELPVTVRAVEEATLPRLRSAVTSVKGGDRLTLNFEVANEDRLTAELVPDTGKGTIEVSGSNVFYKSHKPEEEDTVLLKVKTISKDNKESSWVELTLNITGMEHTILEVPESVVVKESEVAEVEITSNAKNITMVSSLPDVATVNSTKRTIRGVKFGNCKITVTAEAIDCLPTTKEIKVMVDAADVDKPIIKGQILRVIEEEMINVDFIMPEDTTLQVTDLSGRGKVTIEGHRLNWVAPLITEEGKQIFKFQAISGRPSVNKFSEPYDFEILVVGKPSKDVEVDEEFAGLDMVSVRAIVKDQNLTFKEKVAALKKQGDSRTVELAEKLLDYAVKMDPITSWNMEATVGAAKHFELFNILRRTVETKDNNTFQALFDLINLAFKEYKTGAYNNAAMRRFEEEWTGGEETLYSFQNLCNTISALCDIVSRERNLRSIDFELAFDLNKTVFKDDTKQSIIKYYTL